MTDRADRAARAGRASSTSACRCSPTPCAEQGRPGDAGGLADPGRWRPGASSPRCAGCSGRAPTQVDAANAEVLRRLDTGVPRCSAGSGRPAKSCRRSPAATLLHPGPPTRAGRRVRPAAPLDARGGGRRGLGRRRRRRPTRCCAPGEVTLMPANEAGVVVPMATVMGPTTPVWVVETRQGGTTAFAPLGQGPGDVAWFGRDTPAAVRAAGVPARGGRAGARRPRSRDSGPGRRLLARRAGASRWATTSTCARRPRPTCCSRTCCPRSWPATTRGGWRSARFLSANHLLFLTLAMAAARSLTAWAGQVRRARRSSRPWRATAPTFGVRLAGDDSVVPRARPDGRRRALPPGPGRRRRRAGHRRQRGARARRARRRGRRRLAGGRTARRWHGGGGRADRPSWTGSASGGRAASPCPRCGGRGTPLARRRPPGRRARHHARR